MFQNLSLSEKVQLHIQRTKPILNQQALFTDGGPNFVQPMEPKAGDEVKIRFRTARENVEHVYFCAGEERTEMKLASRDRLFDFYETHITVDEEAVKYYFEVHAGGKVCFFNKMGPRKEIDSFFNYEITPGFSTPDWAKGAVFYQIYVDRFSNGDPSNDVLDREYIYIGEPVTRVTDWNKYPAKMGVREFYGGDLQGVLDHLDYLQELGVDVLYLNPIFVSPSNHKYDIQDYDYVDPHFTTIAVDEGEVLPEGALNNIQATKYISRVTDKRNLEASNAFFVKFVEEVHSRGMRVILDGVFNHCGSFNKWMDAERLYENQYGYEKGAYVDKNSPYHNYFKFYNEEEWPYNEEYDGWWGHRTLPKLNYEESRQLYEYILKIGRKWVSPPYNVDGWRLDVAADLGYGEEMNHQFWRDFRTAVKEANPEAIILAEHYDDPREWLEGDQWDTVMNYNAFMEPVTWFFTGMEKHSDEKRSDLLGNTRAFLDSMMYHMSRFQYPSLLVSMNELSNHDHSRFLTRTNQTVGRTESMGPEAADANVNKGIMRAAVMLQMTWPGAPTLYYGDEAGVTGWTDPDNRRTYPWGHEDQELIEYHRKMIRIHKEHEALLTGSLKYLEGAYKVICYGRFTAREKMVVLINGGFDEAKVRVPVWEIGVTEEEELQRIIMSREADFTLEPAVCPVQGGVLEITLPAITAILLKAVPKK
ncbi:MAG TPA: glycoside hydrolase family 13 protein [Candidatus Anaerobutyricum stercoris]|uniref:Glycoside hydrolase family 13 protein n=1 Tax=Candidatus Anaerobutyricum stercoris TaxID=2838457 RepID=A0A9D2EL51_9FIRM|nr:glycoside hydrolase family 13 protein [Candidatus Anaerobutyricum stercoris]